jgi:hypothetical protein
MDRDLHEAVNYTCRNDYAAEPNVDWSHSSRLLCPLIDTVVHEPEDKLGDQRCHDKKPKDLMCGIEVLALFTIRQHMKP